METVLTMVGQFSGHTQSNTRTHACVLLMLAPTQELFRWGSGNVHCCWGGFGARPNLCFPAWHPEELLAAGALVPEISAVGPDDGSVAPLCPLPCKTIRFLMAWSPVTQMLQRQRGASAAAEQH